MSCPFCEINKEKTKIIEENKNTLIILSNPRLMKNHLLIIPKKHVEKLSELNSEEKKEIIEEVIKYQEKILSKIAKGCDIRINHRPFQKESSLKVHHLHIHLQPRELEDELYKKCQIHETKIFQELKQQDFEESFDKLK